MKNTMTDLVTELDKLTQTHAVLKVRDTAKVGMFHDFRSTAVCGKVYAVQVLDWLKNTPGLTVSDIEAIAVMRKDIIEGEYDEPFTKEDEIHCHAEVDNDPTISEQDKAFYKMAMTAR